MQRCKEARSHQQRARTDRTTLDLTSTSTLTLTLYRTVSISVPKLRSKTKAILNPRPERLSPEQTLQGQASAPIEEQSAGQLLHADNAEQGEILESRLADIFEIGEFHQVPQKVCSTRSSS